MLGRVEGATIAEIVAATGWQPHTVRGALAGALKKRLGLTIDSDKVEGRGRVYRIPADSDRGKLWPPAQSGRPARLYVLARARCECLTRVAAGRGGADVVSIRSRGRAPPPQNWFAVLKLVRVNTNGRSG